MVRMLRVQAKPDSRAGVETKCALEIMTIPTRYRHTVVDSYYETEVSVMCEYIFAVGLDSLLCSKDGISSLDTSRSMCDKLATEDQCLSAALDAEL